MLFRKKLDLPDAAHAVPGRSAPIATAERHFVNGRPLNAVYTDPMAHPPASAPSPGIV